ncbi:hypothetical protein L9F63_000688, partial [Diploptera punctata]
PFCDCANEVLRAQFEMRPSSSIFKSHCFNVLMQHHTHTFNQFFTISDSVLGKVVAEQWCHLSHHQQMEYRQFHQYRSQHGKLLAPVQAHVLLYRLHTVVSMQFLPELVAKSIQQCSKLIQSTFKIAVYCTKLYRVELLDEREGLTMRRKIYDPTAILTQRKQIINNIIFYVLERSCYNNNNVIQSEAKQSSIYDLGWNDVGFHGSNQIPTPNIDALAYSGVILNNYYVMPVCTPSRSALMTGLHPVHTGMQHHVIFANEPWGLPLQLKLLPQYLQDLGYATRFVGKWHLGHFRANYTPIHRGFESHYGYWSGHQDYYDHTAQDSKRYWGYDMRRGMNVSWKSYGFYTTDLFTREATRIIQDHDTRRPLFLYLAHLATHSANPYKPLQAPASTLAKFNYIKDKNRRTFAGMLSKMDDSVGEIILQLAKKGMLNDSIIVFSTDNGGPAAGFNSNAASNWPLKGVKDTQWEGGVRGVAVICSTHINKPGRVATHLMHVQDWLPTLLYAVNSTFPHNLDGINVWPSITTDAPAPYHQLLLNIDNTRNISAVRKGQWKLVRGTTWNGEWDGWYGPSGRDPQYKYNVSAVYSSPAGKVLKLPADPTSILQLRRNATVTCSSSSQHRSKCTDCLFDLDSDPCELNNLYDTQPERVADLQALLDKYNKTVLPPRNKPADPRSNPEFWQYTWTNWVDYL